MTELSASTDQLTATLLEAENLLILYCDGVPVDVPLSNTINLGVGKVNNEWCLYIENEGASGQRTRLIHAARYHRVAAVEALASLRARIKDKREGFADALRAAIRELGAFNDALRRELDAEEQ